MSNSAEKQTSASSQNILQRIRKSEAFPYVATGATIAALGGVLLEATKSHNSRPAIKKPAAVEVYQASHPDMIRVSRDGEVFVAPNLDKKLGGYTDSLPEQLHRAYIDHHPKVSEVSLNQLDTEVNPKTDITEGTAGIIVTFKDGKKTLFQGHSGDYFKSSKGEVKLPKGDSETSELIAQGAALLDVQQQIPK